jgi:hypothetical protein
MNDTSVYFLTTLGSCQTTYISLAEGRGEHMLTNPITFAKGLGTFILSVIVMTLFALPVAAEESATLSPSDCVKCHKKEPATVSASGGLHRTAVTCLDCHEEHPPWGEDVIPQCSKCHEGKSHYELENCLACHSDPHQPLNLNLADDVTGPCLTCHEQQGQEFNDYASAHAEQSCTFCHNAHGQIPECFECHEPHAQGQTMNDCLACHPVHHPLQISYALTTPRAFCVPCHDGIGELMSQTTTKHQTFTCAFCHRGTHPSVPQCQTCHGEPHSAVMHKKMPNCIDCHIDPHNLQK